MASHTRCGRGPTNPASSASRGTGYPVHVRYSVACRAVDQDEGHGNRRIFNSVDHILFAQETTYPRGGDGATRGVPPLWCPSGVPAVVHSLSNISQ